MCFRSFRCLENFDGFQKVVKRRARIKLIEAKWKIKPRKASEEAAFWGSCPMKNSFFNHRPLQSRGRARLTALTPAGQHLKASRQIQNTQASGVFSVIIGWDSHFPQSCPSPALHRPVARCYCHGAKHNTGVTAFTEFGTHAKGKIHPPIFPVANKANRFGLPHFRADANAPAAENARSHAERKADLFDPASAPRYPEWHGSSAPGQREARRYYAGVFGSFLCCSESPFPPSHI